MVRHRATRRRLLFPGTKDIGYHPIFKGAVSRWAWRFYTHRLTRAGRWLLGPTLAFAAFGSSSLELQGYVVFLYAAGLWAVAIAGALLCRPRVVLRVQQADRVGAGAVLPVDVEIEQQRGGIGLDLNVLPQGLPPALDALPPEGVGVPALRLGQTARVRLGIDCTRRGVYVTKGFRVETDFPLGLLNAYRVFVEQRPLLVYPRFTPLVHVNIPTGRRYQPGGVALASQLGDSFEFLGNREYREGDNIRDIDWRATARLDKPILREYREEYFLRAAVVLDTQIPPTSKGEIKEARRADLERAVSVCAAVGDFLARQDYLVDLFAAGPQLYHLTAGRSLAYLDQILDILACVDENPDAPFASIEPELGQNLAQVAAVVCVFLDWNPARQAFVHTISREGVGVKVIVVRDGLCTLDPAEANLPGGIAVVSSERFATGVEEL